MRLKVLTIVVLIALTGALGMAQSNPSTPFPNGNVPVPGVFNTNFDPPLFQCYSAAVGCQSVFSATGPQTGIDLRGTPIDTHSIKWSPVGTVSTCQIQVESSADGVTWNSADIIPSTLCTSKGQTSVTIAGVAFVRVNLTVLTGGGSLNVVYGGRFTAATAPVTNGYIQLQTTDYFYITFTDILSGYSSATLYVSWETQGPYAMNTQTLTFTPSTSNQYIGPLTSGGSLVNLTANLQSQGAGASLQGNGALYLQVYKCPNNNGGVVPNANLNQCVELIGSNLTNAQAVAYPSTPIQMSAATSPSYPISLHPSNPSAGANLSYTVPNTGSSGTSLRYRVKSLQFVLVDSSTVQNRQLQVLFQSSGAVNIVQEAFPCTLTAGQVGIFTMAPAMTPTVVTSGSTVFCTQAMPDLAISGNDGSWTVIIQPISGSLAAADQLSGVYLRTEANNEVD